MPDWCPNFANSVRMGAEVYTLLKGIVKIRFWIDAMNGHLGINCETINEVTGDEDNFNSFQFHRSLDSQTY
ncbi:hypothetical protein BLNAU_18088 [Blattamonas nauphoetae]|uniref:Uncharacterized protein n=1 Tax=Blattamonas nauphoetae TaxID=2049346 RepID=A0ABQ9WZA1_9EUKA|nr:hypothetical protein BLNAU_20241 [Blattamonas nauphoetae]KAK2947002.1 hypothetical protein BLNAU_18088 [Blattamonas nauphoetae]